MWGKCQNAVHEIIAERKPVASWSLVKGHANGCANQRPE
jgi:hypothetical protein